MLFLYLRVIHTVFKLRAFLSLVILLLISFTALSQGENKKWYFGSAAGLDFTTNPPLIITSSSMAGFREGTASVADAFGNLLFYTDGETIWDKTDQVMANGSGLSGNITTTQSSLIVKQPGNSNIYFVFTLGGTSGLFYSVVDMNLAAGLGSVTIQNVPVAAPSTEKLTGTKHCNGIDTWVVTHDFGSDVFRSVLVSASGVSSTATLSSAGSAWYSVNAIYGAMKISQNGTKLALAVYHDLPLVSNFEVYDFNSATGVVSNSLSLDIPLSVIPLPIPVIRPPYGVEFSPDAGKLYGTNANDTAIYQWNLCAGSNTAIINSRYKIKTTKTAALQLATDGKIYAARVGENTLGVINSPDLSGASCNYVNQGQSIAPAFCSYGLPNFVTAPLQTPFVYAVNGAVNCNKVNFTTPPAPTVTMACSATGYNAFSATWYFGDPASGTLNTSTVTNPSHIYPGQGTYTAYLVYSYSNTCGGINTDTLKQEVKIGVPTLASSAAYNLCTGNSLTLTAPAGQTYSWSTGATSASVSVSPTVTTTYTVSGLDMNFCPYKSEQTIAVYISPTLSIKGATTVCPGYQVKLTASGAATYSWSSGQTQPINYNIQNETMTYTVFGMTNGCPGQQTVTVVIKHPDLFVSESKTICPGAAVTLTAGGTVNYLWTGGLTGSMVTVSPTVSTQYTVQGMDNKGCTSTTSLQITIKTQTPVTDFYYQSPVCQNGADVDTITVAGFNAGGVFSSPDLQVDPLSGQIHPGATPSGSYYVTYSLAANGCTAAALNSATLEILPGAPLSITPNLIISPGATISLHVSGGPSYTWDPSAYLSCTDCDSPYAFPPENTKFCVSSQLGACIANTCVMVVVTCETDAEYSLPNAFTPNGDFNNDEFCLKGWNFCISEFNVRIFDRWGELVFESSNPDFCWNGIYKGNPLPIDVYYYVVSAKKNNGTAIHRKGDISLLR